VPCAFCLVNSFVFLEIPLIFCITVPFLPCIFTFLFENQDTYSVNNKKSLVFYMDILTTNFGQMQLFFWNKYCIFFDKLPLKYSHLEKRYCVRLYERDTDERSKKTVKRE